MTLGDWTAARVVPSDASGTPAPPKPSEWHDVEVPGRPERFAGADAVAYRTHFPDPRRGSEARAVLVLRGLYAHARVWLNGEFVGTHDAYFAPARFEFGPEQENELIVECREPDDRFGGVYATDLVPDSDAVPGIWWDAQVESHPSTYLADISVTPEVGENGATIDVALAVEAGDSIDDHVTLSLRPQGFRGGGTMERARVEADAGERVTVERTIQVRDPTLWWPRSDGPQHHYAVRAKFGESERTATTGLRTVSYGEDGLLVNGNRVRARGFNLLPGSAADDLERVTAANANLVRAHAYVPAPSVHQACDEAGLLVWQDLPLAGPGEYDADRAATLAATLVDTVGHHPSVAMFGVHDDPLDPYPNGLGTGGLSRLRLRWRAWRASYDDGDDESVARSFDDRPAFPVAGQPGTDPDAAHLYPGWSYGSPGDVDWLLERYPDLGGVVGEFGAGALADGANPPERERPLYDGRDLDAENSEVYQSRVLKTVAEGLRRHGSDVLAAFALRDTATSTMGVLDEAGGEKPGYGALGDSFEPVQAVLTGAPTSGSVDAVVVNDTREQVAGTLAWEAGEETGSAEVTVEALDSAEGGTVRIPGDAETVDLRLSLSGRTVTNRYCL